MDRSEERAALEAVAFSADDSTRPGERLRALELLAELRRADAPPPRTPTEEERIGHYADPDRLAQMLRISFEQGLFDEEIEVEVERRVAERLRGQFGIVAEVVGEPDVDVTVEELNEPEVVEPVPADQVAAFSAELLARQWPMRQSKSLSAAVLHRDG